MEALLFECLAISVPRERRQLTSFTTFEHTFSNMRQTTPPSAAHEASMTLADMTVWKQSMIPSYVDHDIIFRLKSG